MKVLFLHGLESKPGGRKPSALKNAGFDVIEPALPRNDWNASVEAAIDAYEEHTPDIVVGSSRGGAVAMAANLPAKKLVLIAPAWKKYCPNCTIAPNTTILHSPEDRVIAFSDSRLLSKMYNAELIMVGADHRMNDSSALDKLIQAVNNS
jgi:predicted alpha/beta hydrolase family esterase